MPSIPHCPQFLKEGKCDHVLTGECLKPHIKREDYDKKIKELKEKWENRSQ